MFDIDLKQRTVGLFGLKNDSESKLKDSDLRRRKGGINVVEGGERRLWHLIDILELIKRKPYKIKSGGVSTKIRQKKQNTTNNFKQTYILNHCTVYIIFYNTFYNSYYIIHILHFS